MANIIKVKRGPGKPQLSDLSEGEFGIDLTNEVLYYKKDSQLIILGKSFLYESESDDIRIREQNALKFGGIETNDAAFEIRYNEETESLDFNSGVLKLYDDKIKAGVDLYVKDSPVITEANNSLRVLPYQLSGNLNDIIRSNTPSYGQLQFSTVNVSGLPSGVVGGFVVCLRDASFTGAIIVQLYPTGGSTPVIYGRSAPSGITWIE